MESLADAAQRGARRAGAPREDDWAEFLAILFGFLSMLFVWWLVSGLVTPISKQERDGLELTDDEAEGLARPAARLLARSFVNDRYGKHVLGASDYIVMMVVLTTYAERVTPVVRRRMTQRPRPPQSREEAASERTRPRVVEDEAPGQPGPGFGLYGASAT